MFPDILIRLVQLNWNRCLLNLTSRIMMVKISGENFAGADVDDCKNPVMDRNVTHDSMRIQVRDHERAERSNSPLGARRVEQSLRSSLTSGRGSLLAHMLVMLGSLPTLDKGGKRQKHRGPIYIDYT